MSSKRKSNKSTESTKEADTRVIQQLAQEVAVSTAAATASVTVAATEGAQKLRNSDRVRVQIDALQAQGVSYEDGKKGVVDWAVKELGQKRGLARRYVKENWVRVTKARAAAAQTAAGGAVAVVAAAQGELAEA